MTARRSLRHVAPALVAALLLGSLAGRAEAVESAPDPSAPSARLSWKATKEEGVYGYVVYRSTNREGPFLRVGREIVHVSTEAGETHSYTFVDTTVEPGKTYYYYLDTVSTGGQKARFSGVMAKAIPALPGSAPPAD